MIYFDKHLNNLSKHGPFDICSKNNGAYLYGHWT
jgi:hypothetical protein